MVAAAKDLDTQNEEGEFTVKHVLADGDLVAAHTELLSSKSKPFKGGLRQVHLFRFEGDKIVEYGILHNKCCQICQTQVEHSNEL